MFSEKWFRSVYTRVCLCVCGVYRVCQSQCWYLRELCGIILTFHYTLSMFRRLHGGLGFWPILMAKCYTTEKKFRSGVSHRQNMLPRHLLLCVMYFVFVWSLLYYGNFWSFPLLELFSSQTAPCTHWHIAQGFSNDHIFQVTFTKVMILVKCTWKSEENNERKTCIQWKFVIFHVTRLK